MSKINANVVTIILVLILLVALLIAILLGTEAQQGIIIDAISALLS